MGTTFNTQILVDKLAKLNSTQQSIESIRQHLAAKLMIVWSYSIFQEMHWLGMGINFMFVNFGKREKQKEIRMSKNKVIFAPLFSLVDKEKKRKNIGLSIILNLNLWLKRKNYCSSLSFYSNPTGEGIFFEAFSFILLFSLVSTQA